MIPGMIGGHPTPGPVVMFLGSAIESSNSGQFTFSGKDFGPAAPDRHIVLVYALGNVGTFGVDGVTVGGVSATQAIGVNSSDANRVRTAVLMAAVPTGTSGTIVVDPDTSCDWCAIAWFSVTGLDAATASDTGGDNAGDPLSVLMDILPGGFAIGVAASSSSSGFTWSGLNEVVDSNIEGDDRFGVAWREFPGGATGLSVSADPTSDAVESMAVAAWR